jgi:hypothetical protein
MEATDIKNLPDFGYLATNPDLTGFQNLSGLQDGSNSVFLSNCVRTGLTGSRGSAKIGNQ